MNFLTSIVRKATRKPIDPINVLVLVDGFDNRGTFDETNIYFYRNILPNVDFDVVISDGKNLSGASQFATSNHIFLLKSSALDEPDLEQILREFATKPYLNHPYEDKSVT